MPARRKSATSEATGTWSAEEHERFLEAVAQHPQGPWRLIREHVGTRSIKQVQTHAQKYQQKLLRHQRGLRKTKTRVVRPEHRVDTTTVEHFTSGCIVRRPYLSVHSLASPSVASGSPAAFASMVDTLSEAPELTAHATLDTHAADDTHYVYRYGYASDSYSEPSPAAPHSFSSDSNEVPPISGVEPMPYMYDNSTHQPPHAWSEPEAVALLETLEVLLV